MSNKTAVCCPRLGVLSPPRAQQEECSAATEIWEVTLLQWHPLFCHWPSVFNLPFYLQRSQSLVLLLLWLSSFIHQDICVFLCCGVIKTCQCCSVFLWVCVALQTCFRVPKRVGASKELPALPNRVKSRPPFSEGHEDFPAFMSLLCPSSSCPSLCWKLAPAPGMTQA